MDLFVENQCPGKDGGTKVKVAVGRMFSRGNRAMRLVPSVSPGQRVGVFFPHKQLPDLGSEVTPMPCYSLPPVEPQFFP
jgi:hypothetical protein